MARRYKLKLPAVSANRKFKSLALGAPPFDDEARLYSNWTWFRFENDRKEHTQNNDDGGS